MDDYLRARVDRLETDLLARITVLEHVLIVTAVMDAERNNPGASSRNLAKIEEDLATPRPGETAEVRDAIRGAYRRIYGDIKRPPPWKAGGPYQIAASALFLLWDKGVEKWKRWER